MFRRASKLPSDYKILNTIYKQYYDVFIPNINLNEEKPEVLIEIDIHLIAEKLSANPEIVFARLYYYLSKKYSYPEDEGAVSVFIPSFLPNKKHLIHFSYLSSIVANLRAERFLFIATVCLSTVALIVSLVSLIK